MKVLAAIVMLLLVVAASAQRRQVTVYLAGDSTMANKADDRRPETGWGEYLQSQFDDSKVRVENHAMNGRSTKSFIAEGRWKSIIDKLQPGDWVIIEFGHNDEKIDRPTVGAAANGEFRDNLIRMISDVRAAKASPLLMTSVARRKWDEKGNLVDTHGEWPDAMRAVASEFKVPLVDMQKRSSSVLTSLGAEGSKSLFLILAPKENPNYPNGLEDNTHFRAFGAEQMARQVADGIRELRIKLAKYLLDDRGEDFHSRLQPADYNGGFRMDGYWVWCGSTIKGDDGKYHMFASRWPNSTGFGPYWLTNSEVVHAVSDSPGGPYKFSDVALPPRGPEFWDGQMTHNPAIRRFGDTYLLYYTGTTYKGARPTKENPVRDGDPTEVEAHMKERIGLATSKSPYGPWTRLDKPILDVVPNSWEQYLVSNAAPVIMKDGSVRLYYKGVEKLRKHAIGLAVADCPTCEYKRVSDKPLNMGIGAEDPFIWMENGKFKALMLDHERRYSPDKEIFYAVSDDGIKWRVPRKAIAVARNVRFNDGSTRRMNSTERPHVLIENGRPTYVFFATGETISGKRFTWNMAVPLK